MQNRLDRGAFYKEEFCAALKQPIAAAHEQNGNTRGWRLLSSPSAVLDGAPVVVIRLNPRLGIAGQVPCARHNVSAKSERHCHEKTFFGRCGVRVDFGADASGEPGRGPDHLHR